ADQVVGEVARALADAPDADLQDDIQRGTGSVDRRQRWGAGLQTRGVVAVGELGGAEGELVARAKPAGDGGEQRGDQVLTNVDEGDARAAHQPLERASD